MMLSMDPERYKTLCESSPISLCLLALLGGFTGVLSSFIVACTLVEITVNVFFSLYFGVVLLLISALLFYRLSRSHQPHPQRHLVLLIFICLIFLSAIAALLIHLLLPILPWLLQVPLYSLQGLALTFAFYFSLFDLLNWLTQLYHKYGGSTLPSFAASQPPPYTDQPLLVSPLINTQPQIFLLTVISSVMGLAFGLTFALLDVEDASPALLRTALHEDLTITYPMGFVLGAVGAVLNAMMPHLEPYEEVDGAAAGEGEDGEFGLHNQL